MATIVNEQIVTGRKFRKLIDEASRLWLRISFWTKACDVEFDDGETAETKFSNMANTIDNLIKSFQDGVNKIYNYLKGLGFTPNPNSPDGICSAIQNMYTKRYNDGRTQGRTDVVNNPSAYGVSTSPKLFDIYSCSNESSTFNIYTCPTAGSYTIDIRAIVENTETHNALSNKIVLNLPGENILLYWYYYNSGENHWVEYIHSDSVKTNHLLKNKITRTLGAGSSIGLTLSPTKISAGYDGEPRLTDVRTEVAVAIS